MTDPDARCPDCKQRLKPDPETGLCMNVGCIWERWAKEDATCIGFPCPMLRMLRWMGKMEGAERGN